MSFPAALHVLARPAPTPDAPTAILVHGSLDKAESFRRVIRRLPEMATVAYDRRGYAGSRQGGVVDLGGHADDLLTMVASIRADGARGPVVAVGHSLGGDVVVAAALAEPRAFDAVGAFEPPMPWLGFRRTQPVSTGDGSSGTAAPAAATGGWLAMADDPAEEAQRFFSRMVSPESWDRLSEDGRNERRADGPALVADLRSFRTESMPFDVTALAVPSVFGMGGPTSQPHHRRTVEWLGTHVPGGESMEIDGAQHGAHLSHPDHFAAFVRRVVARAGDGTG